MEERMITYKEHFVAGFIIMFLIISMNFIISIYQLWNTSAYTVWWILWIYSSLKTYSNLEKYKKLKKEERKKSNDK